MFMNMADTKTTLTTTLGGIAAFTRFTSVQRL